MWHRGCLTAALAVMLATAMTPASANDKRRGDNCRPITGAWSSSISSIFGKNDTRFNADKTIHYFVINGEWTCRNGEYTHTWTLLGKRGPYRLSADGKRLIKISDGSVSFVRESASAASAQKGSKATAPDLDDDTPQPAEKIAARNAERAKLKKATLEDADKGAAAGKAELAKVEPAKLQMGKPDPGKSELSKPEPGKSEDVTGSLKSEPVKGKDIVTLSIKIVNESKYTAAVGYFAQDGTDEWPAYGSFHITAGRTMTVKLTCRPGKVLCMGARALEDRGVEWGVGLINTINDPSACMYTCSTGLETTRLLKD